LGRSGYSFEEKWFASHLEFRFPRIGSISAHAVELELRQALEPWHVLAEETTSGGTARRVDSSLERVQVKVSGFTPESRYAVVCNGLMVPLYSTGELGEAVAGVRYRARQMSSALHPTIPVHAPLIFDILDTWSEHSIGRCAYHATAPDGREYTARPVNAAEAEARRQERFKLLSHTRDLVVAPKVEVNPTFPMTLDLRWAHQEPEINVKKPGLVS
jgi:uncharacterized protein (DUF2126 family)